jgi:TonB family protein
VTPVPIRVTQAPTRPELPDKPDKPEKPDKPDPGIKVSSTLVKAQDTDPSTKGKVDPRDGTRTTGRRPIPVAAAPKGPSAAEIAEAKAAEERAASDAREQTARHWSNAVKGIRSTLAQRLSGQTEISVPGPGGSGEVWIGYGTYLKTFYEARWRRPSSLPVPVAYVGVAITVARDGRLVRFELMEKSGIKSLDDSVMEVIQRYRSLYPLPAGSSDPERTFRIKFRLEGTTQ